MRKYGPILFLALFLGLAALAVFGLSWETDYDRSPLGSKGLQVWLQAKGIPIVRADGHTARASSELSLRIVPLPIVQADAATTREGGKKEAGNLAPWIYEARLYELPTLIILPKWRGSVLDDEVARESALVPFSDINNELNRADLSNLYLKRLGPEFEEAPQTLQPGQTQKIKLYRAQVFDRATIPDQCEEIAGIDAGALVLQCEDDYLVYVLSDPDLLNNHGLALGENAAFALSLIKELRGTDTTKPVYLDTSGKLLDSEKPVDEGRTYERSTSDLARFLAYPLSVIWGAILLVAALCFWRGAYRFGPALSEAAGNIEISKTAAIEATARLLRLSGNDGRMATQFVQHLLADKAALLFGPGSANQAGIDRMFQRMALRDRASAEALQSTVDALVERGDVMTRSDLHRNLETFRKLLGSIELGSR